jgi:hypothetical protein
VRESIDPAARAPAIAHLKTTLYIAAVSPTDQARGLKAHGAGAHKIVIAAFHILTTGKPYRDLGGDYLDQRTEHRHPAPSCPAPPANGVSCHLQTGRRMTSYPSPERIFSGG